MLSVSGESWETEAVTLNCTVPRWKGCWVQLDDLGDDPVKLVDLIYRLVGGQRQRWQWRELDVVVGVGRDPEFNLGADLEDGALLRGGKRQMVLIARALAQQARVLVLDEPTSNLDFGNQMRVLRHVKELAASGLGLLMTTHFPDFAFLCASRVALMKQGRILAIDRPESTLTQASLEEAYETPLRIVEAGLGIRVVVPRMN
jgi:ABC-type antimicrobial peptide transport system ATPase subunit